MGIDPMPSTSPALGPRSCPAAPCTGHGSSVPPVPVSPCSPGGVLCPSGIEPLGRGWGQPLAPEPAPGDDSCHTAVSGTQLLLTPTISKSCSACCRAAAQQVFAVAQGQERCSHALSEELQAAPALESPACTQGTVQQLLGQVRRGAGRKASGAALRLTSTLQRRCLGRKVYPRR